MKLTKKFTFEAAHCLDGHDRGCNNVHGHSYKLFITFEGKEIIKEGSSEGMLIDFGDIKDMVNNTIVKDLDHCFLYNVTNDVESKIAFFLKGFQKRIMPFSKRTTCENMTKSFFERLKYEINKNKLSIDINKIVLYETEDSFAEYTKEDYENEAKDITEKKGK